MKEKNVLTKRNQYKIFFSHSFLFCYLQIVAEVPCLEPLVTEYKVKIAMIGTRK